MDWILTLALFCIHSVILESLFLHLSSKHGELCFLELI